MPPKKKGKGKKGKKGKKDPAELEMEEKYRESLHRVESLGDQLTVRRDLTIRAISAREIAESEKVDLQQKLQDTQDDAAAISAELTRQYKTMQTQMGLLVRQLEQELQATKAKLDDRESELQKTKDELARVTHEKDAQIAQLNTKLQNMGTAYEVMLQDIFDSLYAKLQTSRANWHTHSTDLIARNKQALLEFGLNPLQL